MHYHGSFLDIAGETVTVHIVTGGSRAQSVEIGAEGSGIFFSGDEPVEITGSFNDPFDVLLRSEASVHLLVRDFVPGFFCASCRDAVVNVFKGARCVFAGFVMPQAYSQGYSEVWEELTLSCIDVLSALQYSPYRNIGTPGHPYREAVAGASTRSLTEIVSGILGDVMTGVRLSGTGTSHIWHDGSRSTGTSKDYGIFSGLGVSELLFLGEGEEDVWKQDTVLEEILRYLNLHIVQEGFDFYVFAWETVAGGAAIEWHDVGSSAIQSTSRSTVGISLANASGNDTTISIGEVYNRVSLTCELETLDTVVESPLDQSALTSPYTRRQLYMREYVVEGSGKNGQWDAGKDKPAFDAILAGQRTEHEGAYTRDWLIRVMDHPSWKFPDRHTGDDLVTKYCGGNANQQTLPNRLCQQVGACLISWGCVKEPAFRKDDTVPSSVPMSTALVVSVNGNWVNDPAQAQPSEQTLLASAPVAAYTGATGAGAYSPADDQTTNYVVLSGSIVLNMRPGGYWNPYLGTKVMPDREGGGEHAYAQKFFKASSPNVHAVVDPDASSGLQPFTEMDPAVVEYKLSSGGSASDLVGKVPVLRCMLVIGGKCAVETGGDGAVSDFEWRAFKERSQCSSDSEYYAQSFTVGFNPAIGDKLLGTEFKIRNNVAYYMGIDAEGTAIPVKRSDALSGKVRFMVVGPVNAVWNEVTAKVEPWSGATTGWQETSVLLLPHVSDIIVKDFEVKLYSDNGGDNLTEECDLVYVSDTSESFLNIKDDITFRISSALTAEERRKLGVSESVRLSTAVVRATGLGVTGIRDHVKGCTVKPEQSYVDSYYTECHVPRITMRQCVRGEASRFDRYTHPAMPDRTFYVQAISRSLRADETVLTLKEVWV